MSPFLWLPLAGLALITGLRIANYLLERRWIAKARKQERELSARMTALYLAPQILAQVQRRRVEIDPYNGFVEVTASCDAECAEIIAQSDAFKPKRVGA